MLYYKKDWPKTRERLNTWWKGGTVNYPAIQITVPRKVPLKDIPYPAAPAGIKTENLFWLLLAWIDACNIKENWREPSFILNRWESYFSQTYFLGEGFPQIWLNLGPGVMSAYLTDYLSFNGSSVWFEVPVPLEWKEILNLRFDPDNKWWQLTKRLAESLTKSAKGKFIVGMPDLGGITDILASLRGTQNLLVDLIDHPREVKDASSLLVELWLRYYREIYEIMQEGADGGSSAWMGIWAPGKWYPIQCDFSAMISSEMFEEFVLPYLREQCRYLDYTIYHWDGPGQIPHLEHLLGISKLNGIQWVPGAGSPDVDSTRWFPLYKRIQQAGKNLVLPDVCKENVRKLVSGLSPTGLIMNTSCDSEEEASVLLKNPEVE